MVLAVFAHLAVVELLVPEHAPVIERDGGLLAVAVDAVILHGVHDARARAEADLHAVDQRHGDPRLDARAPALGVVAVRVGEVGAVNLEVLHALVEGVGDGHGDAVVQVRLAEHVDDTFRLLAVPAAADRHLADFFDRVVVGGGHHLRAPHAGDDGHLQLGERLDQARLEVPLLDQVVHPKDDIGAEAVRGHVDGPNLVGEVRREFLSQRLRQ
jgi:hypothetical protein